MKRFALISFLVWSGAVYGLGFDQKAIDQYIQQLQFIHPHPTNGSLPDLLNRLDAMIEKVKALEPKIRAMDAEKKNHVALLVERFKVLSVPNAQPVYNNERWKFYWRPRLFRLCCKVRSQDGYEEYLRKLKSEPTENDESE
jgi:hypothetical protein